MGHRLPNHDGACKNCHGHHYVAELTISGPVSSAPGTPDEGMVLDFGPARRELRRQAELMDHCFLLAESDPLVGAMRDLPGVRLVSFVPTAENIAAALLRRCREWLDAAYPQRLVSAYRLRLWETPTAFVETIEEMPL